MERVEGRQMEEVEREERVRRMVGLEREEERVRRVVGLERGEERVRREEARMGALLLMGNSPRIILLLSLCLQLYSQRQLLTLGCQLHFA